MNRLVRRIGRRAGFAVALIAAAVLVAVLAGCRASDPGAAATAPAPAPGCLGCHAGVVGLEAAHGPERVGCEACHGGEPGASQAEAAHRGLIRIPGNSADLDRTCGAVGCHPEMPPRLRASIMFTAAGIVAVDRAVFGERELRPVDGTEAPDDPGRPGDAIARIGASPADTHLRGLCASCHLGAVKSEPGPIDESSRGGACNACHLVYDRAALDSLGATSTGAFTHPRLSATPTDEHCFGCHSRSGRISLHAAGLREARPGERVVRTLADGRALAAATGDVHTAAGFLCVDCHPSWEVMGDGRPVSHREDQQQVRCEDCHRVASGPAAVVAADALDAETRRLAARLGPIDPARPFVRYGERGFAFPNVRAEARRVVVTLKGTRRSAEARPPTEACGRAGAHARVACAACHDAWTPQCIGCHTAWDPSGTHVDLLDDVEKPGEWRETPGEVFFDRPTLGVRLGADGRLARFEGFVPGMILTLAPTPGEPSRFRRLFAPLTAHTTQRAARTCDDCHRSPLALGYGRGHLGVVPGPGGRPRWRFVPSLPARTEDGLPADAWVGFPAAGAARGTASALGTSTRPNTRSLDETERARILKVGACLGCHAPGSGVMTAALADFATTDRRRRRACRVPASP